MVYAGLLPRNGKAVRVSVDNKPDTPEKKHVLNKIFGSCRVYTDINKAKPKDEINLLYDIGVWSDTVPHVWNNYFQGELKYCKLISEGFGLV